MDRADEHHQAELEHQQQICAALDRCAKAGADEKALRLLAAEAGVSYWKPTQENINAAH